MDTLISVVIPTHNRVHQLKQAIYSVFVQDFLQQKNALIEIIVVDDASTDATQVMLENLQNDLQENKILIKKKVMPANFYHKISLMVVKNEQPVGGGEARNIGIKQSKGEWVAFLDDDDIWLPNKLSKQLKLLERHPGSIACSAGYQIHYPLGIKKNIYPPMFVTLEKLLHGNCLGGTSVCVAKRNILNEIGGFDPKLRSAQDWDLWLKLFLRGKIVCEPSLLLNYMVHFKIRISNNMHAKYLGAKRFYFKYKYMMNKSIRRKNLAFIFFIKSRNSQKKMRWRFINLLRALRFAGRKARIGYVLSSLPRIIFK